MIYAYGHTLSLHDALPTSGALAERHVVGADAGVLAVEQPASAAHAGRDLVEDQQHAALLGQLAQAAEIRLAGRDHPRLALDRLQHHRRGLLSDRRIDRPEVAERHLREAGHLRRSEEHTSELQSLMRISYAVFCLKKQKHKKTEHNTSEQTH